MIDQNRPVHHLRERSTSGREDRGEPESYETATGSGGCRQTRSRALGSTLTFELLRVYV
jgi:hypothetical protein